MDPSSQSTDPISAALLGLLMFIGDFIRQIIAVFLF